MLDLTNSKLLADVILAGLITIVLITVSKNRQSSHSTPLLLTLLAIILLVIQITVDIVLASGAITGTEQNLIGVVFRWRSVLVALIAGLIVFALLLLLARGKTTITPLTTESVQHQVESDSNRLQLTPVRARQRQRALGSLMGHVAHQLQNRLAIMLSHVELSQSNLQADSPVQEKLTGVHQSLLISSQLLRSVAAFKNSRHKPLAAVDVVKALQQVKPLLTEIMPATIALELTLPEHHLMITGDDSDLQLAIVCLVSDALETLKNDRGEITISVHEANPQCAIIKFHSSGFLPPADTEGNSGTQLALEVGESSQAIGAGFSTLEQVVTRHGGDIDVTSSKDSGTTVILYFPRAFPREKPD